ncbi:hypothetical protein [Marinobacter sp. DY40_1A1]|uniref:hypothetical protein n=1 Tax=Marinobacter sp. DY40_1A1 TaxID=2583229 RepID=UPI001905B30B|nr:hypothetical protein [Marinobacter sp. DY40_1A1]MBK1885630.1 hypothetical protein [Marinobacter sp. DY40_1A1]
MKLNREIQIYKDDEGRKTYVAPRNSEIAIKIYIFETLLKDSFSDPFLVEERDMNSRSEMEWNGHIIKLSLGRYFDDNELKELKRAIVPYLVVAKRGYEYKGAETKAKFSEKAQLAIEDIHFIGSNLFIPQFSEPSEPYEIFMEDPEEQGVTANDSIDVLFEYAVSISRQTIPYMHIYDAYHDLLDFRHYFRGGEYYSAAEE